MDPTQLKRMKDQMDAEHQAQQLLTGALQSSMNSPHTVEQLFVFAVGYVPNEAGGVLSVAMPNGKRFDLMLDPQTKLALVKGMTESNGHGDA